MNFFTFCVHIGKHSKKDLEQALKLLLNSIHINVKNYNLICYTNFINPEDFFGYNVEFRMYYDNTIDKLYLDNWLNLSFNKINVYKDLYDEFNLNYIWIDLDTIIVYDISYINQVESLLVETGGMCEDPFYLTNEVNEIFVPVKNYILGFFWKLNINLYNDLIETFNEMRYKNIIPRYDLQDIFNYHIYIKNKLIPNNIKIMGNNYANQSLNGLSIWGTGFEHPNINLLNNLYYDYNKILRTKLHPDKELHIVPFTFNTLNNIIKSKEFSDIFGEYINYEPVKEIKIYKNDNSNVEYVVDCLDFRDTLGRSDDMLFVIKKV